MANSTLEYQLLVTSRVLQPQTGQAPSSTPLASSQALMLNYQHVTDDLENAEDYQNNPLINVPAAGLVNIPLGTLANARHLFVEVFPKSGVTYPNGFKPAVTMALNGGAASLPFSFLAIDLTTTPATAIVLANPDLLLDVSVRYILVGN